MKANVVPFLGGIQIPDSLGMEDDELQGRDGLQKSGEPIY